MNVSQSALTPQEFERHQPFPLDTFQQEAIQHISEGHSVVVCAPTGSGKTLIADYAAMRAISEGRKLFYTTPLKALSNQKFFDLRQAFGEANVGLLTGDISLNRDARIIVMTTEIFRNMLYGVREDARLLNDLGYVILDECHYMNDSERGTVWEESIIYCPDTVQMVALSATIANAAELTDWINEVHHDTRLVWSDFRPVPLRFSYYDREHILPLFEAPGRMNRKLKRETRGRMLGRKQRIFQPNALIAEMQEKAMLPAIFFAFSRKDCDQFLQATHTLNLLTPEERALLNQKVDDYLAVNPFIVGNSTIACIRNGFGSHHAGLLPVLKHLVENLFQQGLLKVIFATETLAAGINMPARSTVITKISKRTNDGHRVLTASEFLQMSGRAGRRGMDEQGYVVVISSAYEGALEAATLASSPAEPLNSQFTANYGMVLNLLQQHELTQCEFLIRQSFGQFTSARRLLPLEESKSHHEGLLGDLFSFECPVSLSEAEFHEFLRVRAIMQDTRRFMKTIQRQISQHGPDVELRKQLGEEQRKLNALQEDIAKSPCKNCTLLDKHQRIEERIQHEQRKLNTINRILVDEQDTYWRRFMNIYGLLVDAGLFTPETGLSERGTMMAQLRSENEYALAEILMADDVLEPLTSPQLAAVLSALLNDSNRENWLVRLPLSPQVNEALDRIDKIYRKIERLQRKHQVDMPLILNPVASALVEAWTHGCDWERLIASTNIGEGDIVRQLRRITDVLRQIYHLSALPKTLRLKAKEALKAIDRVPIKEVDLLPLPEDIHEVEILKETLDNALQEELK